MKILFSDNNIRTPYGSNRIYIHNLSKWVAELGYEVALNKTDYQNYDIIICDKSFPAQMLTELRRQTKAFIGIANNVSAGISAYDFCIAACPSEKAYSLQYNRNIVLFPQLEILSGYKKHNDNKELVICYHGNREHLEQLSVQALQALEKMAGERAVRLKVIYNYEDTGYWKYNRPDIEIEEVLWNFDTLADEILDCDIGFTPNINRITEEEKSSFFELQKRNNRYKTGNVNDYLIRMKCCVNAGRSFVFHQLGLPVISDIFPEAYHILQNRNCGYLAHSYESWLYGFDRLCCSAEHRQEVADNAKEVFHKLYDPLEHAKNMLEDIIRLI